MPASALVLYFGPLFPAHMPLPPVHAASFGIPDTLFLVVLALVVFGPKKLPEISRQVGKLLYEFRKASNDFKFQIEEELRLAEQAEREKELAAARKVEEAATPVAISATETVSAEPALPAPADEAVRAPEPEPAPVTADGTPTILPPSTGEPVSGRSPYRPVAETTPAAEPEVVTAQLTPEEAEQLEELRADAEDAMKAAAADAAYTSSGDAQPTHHG